MSFIKTWRFNIYSLSIIFKTFVSIKRDAYLISENILRGQRIWKRRRIYDSNEIMCKETFIYTSGCIFWEVERTTRFLIIPAFQNLPSRWTNMLFWLATFSVPSSLSLLHPQSLSLPPPLQRVTCWSFLLASLLILRAGAAHRAAGMRAQRAIDQHNRRVQHATRWLSPFLSFYHFTHYILRRIYLNNICNIWTTIFITKS